METRLKFLWVLRSEETIFPPSSLIPATSRGYVYYILGSSLLKKCAWLVGVVSVGISRTVYLFSISVLNLLVISVFHQSQEIGWEPRM